MIFDDFISQGQVAIHFNYIMDPNFDWGFKMWFIKNQMKTRISYREIIAPMQDLGPNIYSIWKSTETIAIGTVCQNGDYDWCKSAMSTTQIFQQNSCMDLRLYVRLRYVDVFKVITRMFVGTGFESFTKKKSRKGEREI